MHVRVGQHAAGQVKGESQGYEGGPKAEGNEGILSLQQNMLRHCVVDVR